MKRRVILLVVCFVPVLLFVTCRRATRSKATLILTHGVVYTVNGEKPIVESIALRGNRIVGVGSNDEIQSLFDGAKIIDLGGKAVFPGFTDSHMHLEGLGLQLLNVDFTGTTSVEEIQRRVRERAVALPGGVWLRGRSWDQNDWTVQAFPVHQMLDAVSGDHPVCLTRVDGHAFWVNAKALTLAKITRATVDPAGGKIIRDRDGNPTGILIDNAMDLIDSVMPPLTVAERTEAIERAVQECIGFGLTEIHDMGINLEMIGIYKKMIASKRFPFRVYAAIDGINKTWAYYLTQGPDTGGYDGRLTVRALKLYADGALGSRGAELLEPYTDDSANKGLARTPVNMMRDAAEVALAKGFQVCIHAIGDRANRNVLDIYEEVFKSNEVKAKDARFRVEHAQVLNENDIPRFAKLGVLPMMQPTHCTSDMYWAERRLGPDRIKGAYAWRSLIQAGSIIPGGSDSPVESANPLLGFYAAITRQDTAGWPKGGWHADQRMTREEALQSYTRWAAYAAFEEKERGSLDVGKLADIVVLSEDIMKCPPEQIPRTKVDLTIVGGEIVYSGTDMGTGR